MRPRTHRHARAGLTIPELIVLIAVLGLLMALTLPVLGRANAARAASKCLTNARSAGLAVALYANETAEALPFGGRSARRIRIR